jgi:hypothetical protein
LSSDARAFIALARGPQEPPALALLSLMVLYLFALENPRDPTNSSNAERIWLGAAPARWAS